MGGADEGHVASMKRREPGWKRLTERVFAPFLRVRSVQDPEELFRERLTFACGLGAILLPSYFWLDWYVAHEHLSAGMIWSFLGARLLLGIGLGVVTLLLHFRIIPWRLVYATDTVAFTLAGLVITYIIAATWDLAPDLYIGLGQLMMVRCVIVPGGMRRALPTCIGLAAALPVGLALYSLYALGDLSMVTGDNLARVRLAVSGLGGFLVVGVFGSAIYHLMMGREIKALHFDRYRIESVIARGGMGIVYRVRDRELNRDAAMKVIAAEKITDMALVRNLFLTEARRTSQLEDPNIIQVYDLGENVTGDLFYVMEYLRGLDIQSMVKEELRQKGRPLSPARVIHLMRQACTALGGAHKQGLIHRDIKPANLFVTQREGQPDFLKVLDFGLVKVLPSWSPNASEVVRQLEGMDEAPELQQKVKQIEESIADGVFHGTVGYAAPEQVLGEPASAAEDVYALGGVMYYMLTGRWPFYSDSEDRLVVMKFTSRPRRPSEVREGVTVPPDLEGIIMRCLETASEDRYASMDALREALESCIDANEWTEEEADVFWATATIERERDFRFTETFEAFVDDDSMASAFPDTAPPVGSSPPAEPTGQLQRPRPDEAIQMPPEDSLLSQTGDLDDSDSLEDVGSLEDMDPARGTDIAQDLDEEGTSRPPWRDPDDD